MKIFFRCFIVFLFISLRTTDVLAQSGDSTVYPELNKKYIGSYFSDCKNIALQPVRWKTNDWIIFSSVIGASALISTQDIRVFDFFERNRTATTEHISEYGLEPWGSGIYSMGTMGALYLGGKIFKDKKASGTALTAVKAFTLSAFFVTLAKQLIHRHRPYQSEEEALRTNTAFSQYIIDGPASKISYTSFPSGHTNAVFAVASAIAYSYRSKPWVPVIAYSIAGLTGISRIHDKKHWASDVFMGAACGWAIGRFVAKHDELSFTPFASSDRVGLLINIR